MLHLYFYFVGNAANCVRNRKYWHTYIVTLNNQLLRYCGGVNMATLLAACNKEEQRAAI